MRRSTRIARPTLSGSSRSAVLLGNDGDGSTLTLDFTTGVLDPRLTFTRGSNATFINSSGLVQWAASNQLSNSLLAGASGSSGPTGWLVSFIGGTGNFSLSGTELTISNNGSADRSRIYQTGPNGNGLPVTVQMKIVANNTGGLSLAEIVSFAINGQTSATYRVNGVAQTSSYTGWNAGDLVTLTCIPTVGSAATCLFGVGVSNNVAKSASVTIKDVQIEAGTTATAYNPTTTSGAYYAPRFDYDPTTGAPKGLLIEGTATNVLTGFTAGGWGRQNIDGSGTAGALANGQTGPDGVANTAARITTAAATTFPANMFVAFATNAAGASRTFSVWLRGVGSNTTASIAIVGSNTPAGVASSQSGHSVTLTTSTSGNNLLALVTGLSTTAWTRVSISRTDAQASADSYRICPGNHTGTISSGLAVDVYVVQAESGIGMSSTIPTGASTVQRLADKMSMTDISTMQWNQTQGTFLLHMDVAAETNTSAFPAVMGMYTATPVRVVRFLLNNSSGTNPRIGCDTWTAAPAQILTSLIARSSAPTAFKYAAALSNTGQALSHVVNNGSVTTTTGTGTLQTPTRMLWHQDPSALDTEYFPVHIRTIKYWPTALPNATIQALTT